MRVVTRCASLSLLLISLSDYQVEETMSRKAIDHQFGSAIELRDIVDLCH